MDSEECIKILNNGKEAIPKNKGKVIIIEAILNDEKGDQNKLKSDIRLMFDIAMMAHTSRMVLSYINFSWFQSIHYYTQSSYSISYSMISLEEERER